MTSIRVLTFAVLLAFFNTAASAAMQCGEPCHTLVRDAHVLEGQGKYQEALDKYQAAEKADPQASLPVSLQAGLMFKLSSVALKDKAAQVRQTARALAERATTLAADDPIAHEVLRMLDDDGASPLHTPNPRAANLLAEGSALFMQRKPKEALLKYEAAMEADPKASSAWVGAADCHFMQGDWPRAEALFRRATEIEPQNAQAWRFLSDALLAQGQRAPAEAALYASISADPSQRPAWGKLARLRAPAGLPLKPLAFRRGVRVTQEADGKFTVHIDESAAGQADTPNYAIRLLLGISESNQRQSENAGSKSPYEIELGAWRTALKVMDETKALDGLGVTDPALLQMKALAKDGQLEPAILLLMFRQSYRPALEAWLAANPGGVKLFIDRYGLRP
ncbi:tetratricopeptide repeat protein [Massilia sp. CFBP9012]|uniref:tetratricopeptide repeat protein n=1 Tax=Massilia sp. CFBP9012 TaxID=3096531 RepID=UPI002A6AA1BB|nr:tetratricopeptide repeat protein [Massilia sp. CFBP9012]MDY0975740.1 tetratricopeptide repeat protein [Massilia sp. CFBP9012]